ncbi:hypothetical protein BDZ91DRAFT_840794 [Kalaharituber pfeilii]|nr:hypothetical protein BDZ91DRAFT_840794 [Kalaharituber pfeilii]
METPQAELPSYAHVLPALRSLQDVTNLHASIFPFLPKLKEDLHSLSTRSLPVVDFYHNTNPLLTAILLTHAVAAGTFIFSSITRNYSQVDRLWAILPAIYIGHFTYFAHAHGLPSSRLDSLATLALIWSVRLTYNYWRRGGYKIGSEDYRWVHVRKLIPRGFWWLFNAVFISWFQNVLLLFLSLPAYLFLLVSTLPSDVLGQDAGDIHAFGTADLIFSRSLVLAIITEFFADQQQWNFHKAKKAFLESGMQVVPEGWQRSALERGFCITGLWSFSRHPNFLAEQAIWILIYQWGCFVTDTIYNYTVLGPLALCAVFQGSTWLTEKISASKYPSMPIISDSWGGLCRS